MNERKSFGKINKYCEYIMAKGKCNERLSEKARDCWSKIL